jgi:hypothetical protein
MPIEQLRASASRALMPPVNQTALLFGAVAFAFVFFVTIRGDLGKWLGLFGLAKGAASPAPSPSGGAPVGTPGVGGLPATPALPSIGGLTNTLDVSAPYAPSTSVGTIGGLTIPDMLSFNGGG